MPSVTQERMDRVDAAWLHMDRPGNTADIVGCLGFRRPPSSSALRHVIDVMVRRYPRFTQRIHEALPPAGPGWERDPRFRLANHLQRHALPEGDGALQAFVGDVASLTLDPARPPWQMHVVDRGAQGEALVMKLHHCVADGFALMTILQSIASGRRRRGQGEPGPARKVRAGPALLDSTATAIAAVLRDPWRAPALVGEAASLARSLARMTLLPSDPATRLTRPPTGQRRAAWTDAIPLDAIRAVARAAGATVNDVLLAVLAGALRGHLAAGGEPVDRLSMRALVPVNLRAVRADGTADGGLGNRFGLVFLDLPIHLAEPAARLAAVHEAAAEVKRSPDAPVAMAVLGALGLAPRLVERLGTDFFSRKASLVVTNVPGPREPVTLAGSPIDDMMFWVPHPATLGVGVSILSYAGAVRIGVRADVASMKDPSDLVARLTSELVAFGCAPAAPARA